MQITMTPRSRYTGNVHKIVNERVKPENVQLEDDGKVTVVFDVGPINTSGEFRGKMTMSLSELYYLTGILEEKKLQLLLREHKDIRNG